ncbi:MAG TPA: ABC transporter permease [Candidatus Bathyarchaeia archaeon]|nr:ABC transporter permease [Candidatus Bathyarchaeia archaeon]
MKLVFRKKVLGLLRLLRRNKEAIIGSIIVFVFLLIAAGVAVSNLLGVQITPYNPLQQNVGPILAPPSLAHLMGTDLQGRDLFSRIIVATPNDMAVSLVVVGFALAAGAIIGSVAALRGGLFDEALMRFTDVIFALPALVIAMAIAISLGPGVTNMMIALMIIWWPPYARLARGEALRVTHQNYIEAARISGAGTVKILFKHVLRGILITLLVYATLDIGTVILVYSGLSYLGLSVRPPQPDWGEMVSTYQDYLITAPWLPVIPGFIISLVVVGFSLLGDGIRDAMEAR